MRSTDIDKKPTVVDVYPKKSKNDYNQEVSCSSSLLGKDREENELLTHDWQYQKKESLKKSKSGSDRFNLINSINGTHKKLSNSMNHLTELQNENNLRSDQKSPEVAGEFFLKTRNTSSTSLNNVFNGINATQQNQKMSNNTNNKPKNFASSLQSYFFSGSIHKSKNRHNTNTDSQSSEKDDASKFPLPNAYKKSFIHKGHGNCDLYSGFKFRRSEKTTNEDRLHQEITLAAKDLGNWF